MSSIYPCLWFDQNAHEAVSAYCALFKNSHVIASNDMIIRFELWGSSFMAMNGGPIYRPTPAVSYFVYCGSEAELRRLYEALVVDGQIIFSLGKYEWSTLYAWVEDRFGVHWQFDIEDIRCAQKILPNLLFVNDKMSQVKEALTSFTNIFTPNRILVEAPHPPMVGLPDGSLLFAQFMIKDFYCNAMSSTLSHDYDFSPANSFVIECSSQKEIDDYWDHLSANGGRAGRCGWLTDPYGISWQIIPAELPEIMFDPAKAPRVAQKLQLMDKLDKQVLLDAAKNNE